MEELNDMAPKGSKAKVEMLGKYDYDRPDIIKDPYFVSRLPIKMFLTALDNVIILLSVVNNRNICFSIEILI